ncbi:uncharacterized protein LOC111269133 isoform X1 [Varroa jacobsoni]|uniref:Uncharacterized protein n=1 Tax=Varroa destructor TaxID=109461 RepID=A0A7M7IWJ3_VARDE|nr:uncharacterized protein LOC111242848 isoform X1 [Varroa destructor]XP_022643467.1 uncharacterized protein LOC111242848 isoform X1 [Varroa destructor]XP_022643468.1 uncharacterized protein LOC111242848 isoform X1 [Varroa destructor]XP_022643469.1 uncharacterized protein LOC111242848 isoform X1 [Varroa destructor]XP_022704255.1 uncharacterized protein LOC111269133 isoform X1 [Varroa jacobsoni]XP_022704256.1 uncharacterized protein LOC111269133 isoform X1 [Varroa jacobsoni]XP_022704257.1 unch
MKSPSRQSAKSSIPAAMRALSARHRAALLYSLVTLVSLHFVGGVAASRSPQEEISEENTLPGQDDSRLSWGATSGITSAGEPVLLRPYAISLLTRPSTLTASRGIPFVQRMVRSEYASHPFSFLKRGVMMGVDLPDFIMNQQNGNRIQAFRNRLIQSGRR